MFRRHRPSHSPHDVYNSSLFMLHYGYALWHPEPHRSGEPQIGDVGYTREGAFIRLFSLNTSKPEHQVTFWDDSEQFELTAPLPRGIFDKLDQRKGLLATGHYRSHGVQLLEFSGSVNIPAGPSTSVDATADYTCKESQGAVLVLNRPAHLEAILKRVSLRRYMRHHHGKWYAYARDVLDQDVSREDVTLVTGCIKTSPDWKVVAFMRSTVGYHGSLGVHALGGAGAQLSAARSLESSPPRMHREGALYASRLPSDATTTDEPNGDQCLFLQRYRIKWRGLKIVAGAGYHELPRDKDGQSGADRGGVAAVAEEEDDDNEGGTLNFESEHQVADPLEVVLDYILEASDAEVAIASDDDVRSIVGDDTPVDFSTYLRHLQPSVDVEDSCGTISIPDTISRQQKRALAHPTITPSDPYKWPGLSPEGAASMETGRVFIGPTEADTHDLKCTHSVFRDASPRFSGCRTSAVSPDGKLLAASFWSNTALVWRLSDGLLVQRLQEQGHTGKINFVALSPDSHTLVSGSDDKSAIIWDVRSGHALRRLEGHNNWVWRVAYSPDGLFIATGSLDYSLKIWDASSGACLHSLDLGFEVYKTIFSADGSRLVVRSSRRDLIYDIRSGVPRLLKDGPEYSTWGANMDAIAMSLREDRIVAGFREGAEIRSIVTGVQLLSLNEHRGPIHSVAFSPDGAEVATASEDGTVVVCDSWSGQRRHVYRMSSEVGSVAYSPDGDFIAMGEKAGRIRVCDAKSGTFAAEFEGHTKIVRELQFTADSRHLLSFSNDGTVRMWNVRDVLRIR